MDKTRNFGYVCAKPNPNAIDDYATELSAWELSSDLLKTIEIVDKLDQNKLTYEGEIVDLINLFQLHKYQGIKIADKVTNRFFNKLEFDNNQYRIINSKNKIDLISYLSRFYGEAESYAIYLDISDYGNGFCGIRYTSSGYFDAWPQNLDLAQSVILVTLISDIKFESKGRTDLTHREKINMVLDEMLLEGYIDQTKYDETQKEVDRLFAEGLPKRTSDEVF